MSVEPQQVIQEVRASPHAHDADHSSSVEPTTLRRRWLLIVLAAVVTGLVIWGRWLATHPQADAPIATKNAPVPVVLGDVVRMNVEDHVTGIGTVQANASATVRVRVDGQIERLYFTEGQEVAAGQLLAQIDPASLRAQLKVAEAQLARDQATLNNARVDLQRYHDLLPSGLVSRQTAETQTALVTQLEAVVAASQAQVDYARVQLGYTQIRAPIAGRVGTRLIDAGNMVRASEATGLVVINQIDPIALSFTLPEDQFRRVNAAMQQTPTRSLAVVALGDDEHVIATGKLTAINNQIDTSSGTVQLKALFANPHHELWPGQFVHARLVLGQTPNALVIPASAVQRGPEGTFVYRYQQDGSVSVAPVTVARYQDQLALISAGLDGHEKVVVKGQSKLRPGSKVIAEQASAE